jgi:hypothetical protein
LFFFSLELEQELDDKTEEIKKLANETSTKLKSKNQKKKRLFSNLFFSYIGMEQARDNRDDHDKNNAQWRIKESQIFVLTRRFRDIMTQYNLETITHRERCKKAIVRELEIGKLITVIYWLLSIRIAKN